MEERIEKQNLKSVKTVCEIRGTESSTHIYPEDACNIKICEMATTVVKMYIRQYFRTTPVHSHCFYY